MSNLIESTYGNWNGNSENTIAVLMSGGVDSAVTAALLKDKNYNLIGVTMPLPHITKDGTVTQKDQGAVDLCRKMGVPHFFVNIAAAFEKNVIGSFKESYLEGITPNPCVICNISMKFGLLWKVVEKELGVKNIATGHYARIEEEQGKFYLKKAKDIKRDQTYFIYGIPAEKLSRIHLPLGGYTKDEVREIARERDLPVAEKPDSMELCFAQDKDYREILQNLTGGTTSEEAGNVYDTQGNILARHTGIWNYTIGQRKGLGFALPEPRYVLEIRPQDNSIVVGTREEAYTDHLSATNINVLIPEQFIKGEELDAKIRSFSPGKKCKITSVPGNKLSVEFAEKQFSITPGQHIVLYNNEKRVVAGGMIV
jgi:tRNA-specific 2-thiouridylase